MTLYGQKEQVFGLKKGEPFRAGKTVTLRAYTHATQLDVLTFRDTLTETGPAEVRVDHEIDDGEVVLVTNETLRGEALKQAKFPTLRTLTGSRIVYSWQDDSSEFAL